MALRFELIEILNSTTELERDTRDRIREALGEIGRALR